MRAGQAAPVRVEVLGPLRLVVDGDPVEVPGPKRRAVLAILALAESRPVPVDHLLAALWSAELPESGRQALHNHISRLRAHLGTRADRLETRQDGYRLGLERDESDLTQARALLATGRATADPPIALAALQRAYDLWRGPVLADLTEVIPIVAAVEAVAQLRREVTDALLDAALAAGQAGRFLALADASLSADPLREPAALRLIRALAADGQAPQALQVAREFRRRLVEESGLDPSPALGTLEREVLAGTVTAAPAQTGAGTVPAAPVPTSTGPRDRAPYAGRHTEPAPAATAPAAPRASQLFGRDAQVAALHRLLASERLVTLVGPGGVGKTRVAREVARQSGPAPVLLLAPVTDPGAICHALASTLELTVVRGDVLSACLAVLSEQGGLLVVDNCEHLLAPVRDLVDTLLATCPRLSVLATSREPLGLAAEHTFRLAPLPLPVTGRDLRQVPSVALFLDRAGRVRPDAAEGTLDLDTVVDIVRRLDGMPLAIELAAGRLSTFSLADLRSRLDRSLDLLGGPGGDSRHRTLRATVEWSYRLLTEDEQRLFRQLSVFPDGVDLPTAEQLGRDLGLTADPGSVLARLVDTSMLQARFGDGTRYRMLETLRAFGLDQLAAEGEAEQAGTRLLRWAVSLTGWLDSTMYTAREPEADAVLRRELPNLRAAWRLARDRGSRDDAAAMVVSLFQAIAYRDLTEIRDWAQELAADPGMAEHPRAAAVLGSAAEAAYHRGDYHQAERLARAGLARATDRTGSWCCRVVLAVAALARGSYEEVVAHSRAAVATDGHQGEHYAAAALARAYQGELDEARQLLRRGSAMAVSPSVRSWSVYVAGEVDSLAGDSAAAERHYAQAIELARSSGATFLVGIATVGLLTVRAATGQTRSALAGFREVIDYFAGSGNWTHLWTTLRNLADLLRRLGDEEPAALIDAAADQAPDAPAVDPTRARTTALTASAPSRDTVLAIARAAIARNLSSS